MDLAKYDVSQATHWLKCRHQIGRNGYNYQMPCVVLHKTKAGKFKIIVFGRRMWLNTEHRKRIRYVYKHKLVKKVK